MVPWTYKTRLLAGTGAYLALYALAAISAWALRVPPAGRFRRAVMLVQEWGGRLYVGDALRWTYYLGLPYWALHTGWLSPIDVGIANLDWVRSIGWAAALGTFGMAILLVLWWQYAHLTAGTATLPQSRWLLEPLGWAPLLRESVFAECWVAVCRGALLLWLGPYWAIYGGVAAVGLAAWLNPRTRLGLQTTGEREQIILAGSAIVLTSTLWVFAPNLWVSIALHFLLRTAILQFALERRQRESSPAHR